MSGRSDNRACAASSPTSDSMCNIARTSESGNKIHSEEKLSFRECESESRGDSKAS